MTKRRFYLVAGSKGGVGKSLTTMSLIDYMRTRGHNVFLFESDTSNPDVGKAHINIVDQQLVDLDQRDGWIDMVNRVGELDDHICVVNTGSRNNGAIRKFGELLATALEVIGVELVTIWLINGQRDSVELLHQYREALPNARIHVLRNEHCASEFGLYDSSEIRKELERKGGSSHTFPALATRCANELYSARQTLEALETAATSPLGNRVEVRRWRNLVGTLFDTALS